MGDGSNEPYKQNRGNTGSNPQNNSKRTLVRQKRRYTKGPGNANGQGRNQQILREIQIKNSNTHKPASCENIQNHKYGQKTKKEAPNRPYKGHNLRNTRMVPRWG